MAPGTETQDPRPTTRDLGPSIQNHGPMTRDPGPKTSRSTTQDIEPGTPEGILGT